MTDHTVSNRWDAADYDGGHAFVHQYGESVLELLDPQPGERILDLGCGTGHLTAEIAEAVGPDGEVVGVDRSAEMVARAREMHPELAFERADAAAYDPNSAAYDSDAAFDAVFSNAALHWITDQDAVTGRVAGALGPGGRYVAELGGRGNVARVVEAVLLELHDRGYDGSNPWYFPTVAEHAGLLEAHGFAVRLARLFDRPTELDGGADGLGNWLRTFGDSLLAPLDEAARADCIGAVEDRLRDDLFDEETGTWTADYRRLRFVAVRED